MTTAPRLIDLARARAEAVLDGNGVPVGLLPAHDSRQSLRARDAMIAGLGLMVAREPLGKLHWLSLATLRHHQTARGRIPLDIGTGTPDTQAASLDASLWFILGHHAHLAATGDTATLASAWESLRSAHLWLEYQDSNECGLPEVHEGADRDGPIPYRHNTLLASVLWFAAQRAMARMARALGHDAEAAAHAAAAGQVRAAIDGRFRVGAEERPHYLPWVGPDDAGDRFDTTGNLLAILLGVADAGQTEAILGFVRDAGLSKPWPVRTLSPVIHPGDRDWRESFRTRGAGLPHQEHNGGAWPVTGGFLVAALVKARRLAEAAATLERLAQMNRRGRSGPDAWEFNAWFHGESARPMGAALHSGSAGMFVYAHECVQRGACPFFEDGDW